MPNFKAKVIVSKVAQGNGYESVTMFPLFSPDPADPNYTHARSTPGGEFRLAISKPELVGQVKEKQVYLVDFTLLDEDPLRLPAGVVLPPKPVVPEKPLQSAPPEDAEADGQPPAGDEA